MNRQSFLSELRSRLTGLPQEVIEGHISFYNEMIDDRMEEGSTEEEAVAAIGSVDEVVAEILDDYPLSKLVKEKIKPKRRLQTWEIILLILGSPIWVSLLIAAFAVLLSVYIVLWSLIVSLWAIEMSFGACALAGVAASLMLLVTGDFYTGLASLGTGFFFTGLMIFMFFACKAATKGILLLSKKIALGTKSLFIGKGDKNEQNS